MSEPLVAALLELPAPLFSKVVDAEIRLRMDDDILVILKGLLPQADVAKRERGKAPPPDARIDALAAALRDPDAVERWYSTLCTTKRRIERQIAAKHSELVSKESDPNFPTLRQQYHHWRAGVLRLINAIDDRIDVARELTDRFHVSSRNEAIEQDRNELGRQVETLLGAIRRHKDATQADLLEATSADEALWRHLP